MLNIGKDRECFFDDTLLDTERTTADFRVHEPVKRGVVMTHGEAWEGDGCDFYNFFFDDSYAGFDGSHPEGVYRMYYLGWQMPNGAPDALPFRGIRVCYAESPDGIRFVKPKLGLSEFDGSRENNILLGDEWHAKFDNFMVFRDDNPACPPDERYKAVAFYQDAAKTGWDKPRCLLSYLSPDGIHFRRGEVVTDKGRFDTLNVAFYDARAGKYRCYIRDLHEKENELPVRDIRTLESPDFVHWTDPVPLDFGDAEDLPLYTNNVSPYPRAPQILVGFPTRYVERSEWTGNYDELCGREKRLERMKGDKRYGLAVTDCVFMSSRDGVHFKRFDDALFRPGSENGRNWVYGDCYPARGFAVTRSDDEGDPDELSMYLDRNHFMNRPTELVRYTLRMDGFVSLHAGYAREETVVTKPFVYDGTALKINFSTSARGYMTFALRCGAESAESTETFGDALDRTVAFRNKDAVGALCGKEVVLEIRMRDADLYAIRFE